MTPNTDPHTNGTTCPDCGAGPAYMTPMWESDDKATLAELIDAQPEPDAVACRNCEETYPVDELLTGDTDE